MGDEDATLPEFGTAEYWEKEYENEEEVHYDWLLQFNEAADIVENVLQEVGVDVADYGGPTILHLGNGNSTFPEQLLLRGYRNQLVTDVSDNCARMLRKRNEATSKAELAKLLNLVDYNGLSNEEVFTNPIQYEAMDATNLLALLDDSFDVVLEKACYDAMFCHDNHAIMILQTLKEAYRTMKTCFVSISMHPPNQVDCFLRLKCFGWEVETFKLEEQRKKKDCEEINKHHPRSSQRKTYHYVYVCRGKSKETMARHWDEVFNYVSEFPDEDPPKRLCNLD